MSEGPLLQEEKNSMPNGGAALVVALDFPSVPQALALAESLKELPLWFKVGLELFTAGGPDVVTALLQKDFSVFLDLKFHDIPNTVQSVTRTAAALGVHMTTLHLEGGEAMCRAAVEGRREALSGKNGGGKSACGRAAEGPLLMGVTVLTSTAEKGSGEIRGLVVERALKAQAWGLDGVVCSGQEAAAVKKACGKDFLCLCPGIRFRGEAVGDQARVTTPEEAVRDGANFLVMGRPITRDASPRAAAVRALESIAAAQRNR